MIGILFMLKQTALLCYLNPMLHPENINLLSPIYSAIIMIKCDFEKTQRRHLHTPDTNIFTTHSQRRRNEQYAQTPTPQTNNQYLEVPLRIVHA